MTGTIQELEKLELKIGDRIHIFYNDDTDRELTSFWVFWKKYKTDDDSYEIRLKIDSISDDKKIIECDGFSVIEYKDRKRIGLLPSGFSYFTKELLFSYIKDKNCRVVVTRASLHIFDSRQEEK